MQRLIVVFGTLLLGMACHPLLSPYQKDRERVKALVDTFVAANNRSDLNTILSLYEQDAELMPPGRSIISGKSAIENNYRQLFNNSTTHITSAITEITVGDLWAAVAGRNTGTTLKKDSATSYIYDKYMMLLEKQESGWKIRRLIWNSNISRSIESNKEGKTME